MKPQTPIPVAIIGMSCRLPGGIESPEQLWKVLSEGQDTWTDVPSSRWNWESFHHPSGDAKEAFTHRGGHFLTQDISAFDANFFGIPSSEAPAIDPQHRIQLETAFEALENAGLPLESVRGSNTAVYVATFSHDYDIMSYKDTNDFHKYHFTGTGPAIAANRISYTFDLKGPSVSVDTGCSGGMVALHQACQSLQTGESDMALVGGTNLILAPDVMIPMSMLSVLNKDGKCYSFDSRGSGYGRGEGVASLVLKRLDDALESGDPVRAVIRGTGLNQDGRTAGIMLPSQEAQEDLVRSVYQTAGLEPCETPVIETHGTGTVAGDNAEVRSISNVFTVGSNRKSPIYIGTVKANIGHLESTSGMAAVIKTAMMLENGLIPANIKFQEPKHNFRILDKAIEIPTVLTSWPTDTLRRASVNNFGYGGTNAHAILETVQSFFGNYQDHTVENVFKSVNGTNGVNGEANANGKLIFSLTANSQTSLQTALQHLREWLLGQESGSSFEDLAYTLSTRRSILQWRWTSLAESHEELCNSLKQDNLPITKALSNPRLVFVFTGQGAQWFAMGRELIVVPGCFKESIVRSDEILRSLGASWSLVDELLKDKSSSRINESEISQPASTAIQIALVDLLASLSIKPAAVLGHSSGEIAAAYAAGALGHEMALKVSYHRSFISKWCKENDQIRKGAMIAAGLGLEDAASYIAKLQSGTVTVACVNSPTTITISGDEAAVDELHDLLDKSRIFNRKLQVDTAYHSHHMAMVADKYFSSLNGDQKDGIQSRNPDGSLKFYSSVTGIEKESNFRSSYWVKNLTSRVRFSDALESLCSSEPDRMHLIVELGPHSALSGPVRETIGQLSLDKFKHAYYSCFIRHHNAMDTVLDVVRKLFEQGYPVDLGAANHFDGSAKKRRKVITNLPPYSWDHTKTYWHESRLSKEHRLRQHPYHDLLGLRVISGNTVEPIWRNVVSTATHPWLRDHVIDNFLIFPGSGYMCMAIEALRQQLLDRKSTSKLHRFRLRDITFSKALAIPEAPDEVEIQLSLRSEKNGDWEEFLISSLPAKDGAWSENCHGFIRAEFVGPVDEVEDDREERLTALHYESERISIKDACSTRIDAQTIYSELRSSGNAYGPSFAAMQDLSLGDCLGFGNLTIPDVAKWMPSGFQQPHLIHPSTLDVIMHSGLPVYMHHSSPRSVMPVSVKELIVSSDISNTPGHELEIAIKVTPTSTLAADLHITAFGLDQNSNRVPVVSFSRAEIRVISEAASTSASGVEKHTSYKMTLGQDVDFLDPKTFEHLERSAGDRPKASGLTLENERHLLNQAASLYVGICLENIEKESRVISSDHYIKFHSWMNRFWNLDSTQALLRGMTSSDKESCLQNAHTAGVLGEVLSRIGPRLPSILTGEAHPLAILLEDNLLSRLYAEDVSSNQCYLHMKDYVKHLGFKNPHMVILEIGAGTGGATVPLLQSLVTEQKSSGGIPLLGQYDFTDISTGFFDKARPLLDEWLEFIRFKALNLESSPISQGFVEGSYDLIVASNVVHATKVISRTLTNVRKLLKPGGRLILIEVTRNNPAVNVTSGVHEGWWAGFDDGRKDAPLLSIEQWDSALKSALFDGIEIVANDWNGQAQMSSMVVARTATQTQQALLPSLEIILQPTSTGLQKFATDLAHITRTEGFNSSVTNEISSELVKESIYLVIDNSNKPLLEDPSSTEFSAITRLLTKGCSIMWISAQADISTPMNPEKSLIDGLARVARRENGDLKLVTLDIQQRIQDSDLTDVQNPDVGSASGLSGAILQLIVAVFYQSRGSEENEYVYKDGKMLIPRLVPATEFGNWGGAKSLNSLDLSPFHQADRPLKLEVQTPGLLDSLRFIDDEKKVLGDNEVEIEAKAFGVNFKDVFVALGQMSPGTQMLGECAGVVVAVGIKAKEKFLVGDRVCGHGGSAYSGRPRMDVNAIHRLPSSMSFAEGASIPIIFSTAYIGLVQLGHLQKGQKVFIPSGSGGVGQAAIMISQYIGAEIFTTVGSASKRQLLVEKYQIPESHIFSSRLGTFKWGILRLTERHGVDVVLSALAGEARADALECVANFGTFVEIGKSNGQLSMESFDKNISLSSLDLTVLLRHQPERLVTPLAKVMAMFKSGICQPVYPLSTMPLTDIEEAFRLIQGRKHTGKIILLADNEVSVKATRPKRALIELESNATYVVAGGLGSLGEKVCRLLASHGARHILILSRSAGKNNPQRKEELEKYVSTLGANLHIMKCDITVTEEVRTVANICKRDLPPVRGIMQCVLDLHDTPLESMNLEMYRTAIRPKLFGTRNLDQIFKSPDLDFFVMLSSVVALLGCTGLANYAAGGAYQDSLANNEPLSNTRYLSLDLGFVKGTDQLTNEREKSLLRQGGAALEFDDILPLLEYSISKHAVVDSPRQLVIGIHTPSLLEPTYHPSAIFSHLLSTTNKTVSKDNSRGLNSLDELLVAAASLEEIYDLISASISKKISTLVAIDNSEISLEMPMSEFGFDSLVSIELKNWISRSFKAAMQSSEILDAANIMALTKTVATRSTLVNRDSEGFPKKVEAPLTAQSESPNHQFKCCRAAKEVQILPLLDLDTIMELYLASVEHLCTKEGFTKTQKAAMEFKEPGSIGNILYNRLAEKAADPNIDNWLSQIYLEAIHIHRRYPLVPFCNFALSHFPTKVPHTQAERATVIALAALEFKRAVDHGTVEPQYLNEKPLCHISHDWLFGTVREPGIGSDQMKKYEGEEYCIVLRRGHVFKVKLSDEHVNISYFKLKSTFEKIIDKVAEDSWAGILTADCRDSWAHVRLDLKSSSPSNDGYIKVIEEATFLICLDNESPTNARERISQFLMKDGFNRWNDKSLQFIVCSNGVSGLMVEHSMIDGTGIKQLNDYVAKAIQDHKPELNSPLSNGFTEILLDEYTLTTTPGIDVLISNIRSRFIGDVSRVEFNYLSLKTLPLPYLRSHRCPTKSIFEVVVQVSSRRFFGYNPASWQPVSMEHYHKGRPELVQTVTKEMLDFCSVANDDTIPVSTRRKMLVEAAKSNAKGISRAQRAQGYQRVLGALEHLLKEGEEMPSLFLDETYNKTGPDWIMTGAPDLQVSEGGFVLQNLGAIWVQYVVQEEEVRFSITGPKGRTDELVGYLEEAAQMVKGLLDSE